MLYFRPDILKNEMKVFFVKYNDPIYVLCCISGPDILKNAMKVFFVKYNAPIYVLCCISDQIF